VYLIHPDGAPHGAIGAVGGKLGTNKRVPGIRVSTIKQFPSISACSVELYFSARLFNVSPGCTSKVTHPPGAVQLVCGVVVKVMLGIGVRVGVSVGVSVSMFCIDAVCVIDGIVTGVGGRVVGATVGSVGSSVSVGTGDGNSATRSTPSVSAREKLPRTMLTESRAARLPKSTWRK
jgi:hypothetical protein